MIVAGVESSCDECSVAVVRDGREILGHVVHSQIEAHRAFQGVVPEIASRRHTEWVLPVFTQALAESGIHRGEIDVVAATTHPGLSGSLLVGTTFAKGLALALGVPFVGVNHMLAHLYAPALDGELSYPSLALLLSGGHTMICRVDSWNAMTVLGATVDDACGEAFDKVAKYHGYGYPGGIADDRLSRSGDPNSYRFPDARLDGEQHRFDVSYSGLKTAATAQAERFRSPGAAATDENLAASFERAAIGMVLRRLDRVVDETGITELIVGGGVAANTLLRSELGKREKLSVRMPRLSLCTDNAAMIAGVGYQYARAGMFAGLDVPVGARVSGYRAAY